jgi:hypothetical protein
MQISVRRENQARYVIGKLVLPRIDANFHEAKEICVSSCPLVANSFSWGV